MANYIDSTLGNFNDAAAQIFSSDLSTKQFIGITSSPTTPVLTRPIPPLAYPNQQQKQSSSTFNSNGVISSSQSSVINSNNRTYNNNIINNNNPAIIHVNNNNYQPKTSSSLQLAPPPSSRASIAASNNNTFVRPSDNKPLMINGRSGYANQSQPGKHEVSVETFQLTFLLSFVALNSA